MSTTFNNSNSSSNSSISLGPDVLGQGHVLEVQEEETVEVQIGDKGAATKDGEGIDLLPVSTPVSTVAAVTVDEAAIEAIQAAIMIAMEGKSNK